MWRITMTFFEDTGFVSNELLFIPRFWSLLEKLSVSSSRAEHYDSNKNTEINHVWPHRRTPFSTLMDNTNWHFVIISANKLNRAHTGARWANERSVYTQIQK